MGEPKGISLTDFQKKVKKLRSSNKFRIDLENLELDFILSPDIKVSYARMQALLIKATKETFKDDESIKIDAVLVALGLLQEYNNRHDNEDYDGRSLLTERRSKFIKESQYIKNKYGYSYRDYADGKAKNHRGNVLTHKTVIDTLGTDDGRYLDDVAKRIYSMSNMTKFLEDINNNMGDYFENPGAKDEDLIVKLEKLQNVREEILDSDFLILADNLCNLFLKLCTDNSCFEAIVKKLDDIPMKINHEYQYNFCKLYIIKLIQKYCATLDEVDLLLAVYGLLRDFERTKYEDVNSREKKYWEYAHEYNECLKKELIDSNINIALDTVLEEVLKSLSNKLAKELSDNGKLGLVNDVISEFKKTEVFDGETNTLFLPKSIFEKDNPPSDDSNSIEKEISNASAEEGQEDEPINEGAEDSETNNSEPILDLADELYDMFFKLRSDNTYFEVIVKKLDYIPTEITFGQHRDFCKLYIIRIIQRCCKTENDAEFLLAMYGLLRKYEEKKCGKIESREIAYYKYSHHIRSNKKIDKDNICEAYTEKHKEISGYLVGKIITELHNENKKLGIVSSIVEDLKNPEVYDVKKGCLHLPGPCCHLNPLQRIIKWGKRNIKIILIVATAIVGVSLSSYLLFLKQTNKVLDAPRAGGNVQKDANKGTYKESWGVNLWKGEIFGTKEYSFENDDVDKSIDEDKEEE